MNLCYLFKVAWDNWVTLDFFKHLFLDFSFISVKWQWRYIYLIYLGTVEFRADFAPSISSKGTLEFFKGNPDLMNLYLMTDNMIKPWILPKVGVVFAWLFVVNLVFLITKGGSKWRFFVNACNVQLPINPFWHWYCCILHLSILGSS